MLGSILLTWGELCVIQIVLHSLLRVLKHARPADPTRKRGRAEPPKMSKRPMPTRALTTCMLIEFEKRESYFQCLCIKISVLLRLDKRESYFASKKKGRRKF